MRSMRVLMTADTVGGVWTYALELARGLACYGAEVTLATMGAPLSPSQRREAARLNRLILCESAYKLEWMDEPWADVDDSCAWLWSLAQAARPDAVHLNTYAHGALPWKPPVLMVGHSCVLSWWQAVKGEDAPAEWGVYRRRVQAGLQGADLVVAPSEAMLAALRLHYGPLPASTVIYNGSRPDLFRPARKEPFILAIGRLWDEAKNIALLERAAPRLPWPVYVAGEQRHPAGGYMQVQHVQPLGRLSHDDVRAWLARAAIYALPARYEPFGLSALEAALSGCALVLGDIASLREIWADSALYVPPDDAEALVEVLSDLIRQPRRRARLAAAARARAARYRPESQARAYWNAYQSLAAGAVAAQRVCRPLPGSLVAHPLGG
ncbi:MAG TPA: glycosyltransferase family 4 protein [Caldilineaceae bacterium]|nr:glycosyltransferase family 4 protein [Caldilineaceae bacterium]